MYKKLKKGDNFFFTQANNISNMNQLHDAKFLSLKMIVLFVDLKGSKKMR
jgi:hypothetical protein